MKVAEWWDEEDVLELDNSLTAEQCQAVLLLACVVNHDAETGVNWDVLRDWIDYVKGEPDTVDNVLENYGKYLVE